MKSERENELPGPLYHAGAAQVSKFCACPRVWCIDEVGHNRRAKPLMV